MVSMSLGDAIHVEIAPPPPVYDDRCMLRHGNWADLIDTILKRDIMLSAKIVLGLI